MATPAFKDLFSLQAADYARFRPVYPLELYAWLASKAPARRLAVDVGTGNGQAAVALAAHFERVIGVEPSDGQLANATPAARVEYRRGAAEATGLDAGSADLLTVAQAIHWFKHPAFFAEVRRVVRPQGLLAFWCYGLTTISPEVDAAVHHYYEDLLGPYWEPERKLVEQGYRTIAVPFNPIAAPAFAMQLSWSFEHLLGYLGTWSPRKPYLAAHGQDALELAFPRLREAWGAHGDRPVHWPLSVRAFRI
ncbi:MAG TPA: class I SAM-dependent methyltransferase [Polyangia bacterium]